MLAQKPQNLPKTTSYAKMNQKKKERREVGGKSMQSLEQPKKGKRVQTHPLKFAWDYPVCPNGFIDFQ